MELFVIRHAIAAPGSTLLVDAERPLTPQGRERFAQAVLGLQRLKVRFDRLYHSPWRRAAETAELLAPVLAGKAVDSPALARAPSQDLLEILRGERVALVGHEPWMGELVAWLTTGAPSDGGVFAFKRGGVAWLEGPPQPGQMVLQAFLTPRVLRTLGRAAR
jgi:phosphohistidine phosphatase